MSYNAIATIKADHQRVENLYQCYQHLARQPAEQQAVVEHICQALEIHAKLERDLLYPAGRAALAGSGMVLVAGAAKEHITMKRLISQLQTGIWRPLTMTGRRTS